MARAKRRGAPVVALGAILCGWLMLRTLLWQSPFPPVPIDVFESSLADSRFAKASVPVFAHSPEPLPSNFDRPVSRVRSSIKFSRFNFAPSYAKTRSIFLSSSPVSISQPSIKRETRVVPLLSPLPSAGAAYRAASSPLLRDEAPSATNNRWSLNAWALLRPNSAQSLLTGPFAPGYGGSQAGAVLRYDLAPNTRYAPRGYARITQAFVGGQEAEAALGVSARPVPALPIRVMAEARVQRTSENVRTRPAVLAVTELPPVALPLHTQADIYAQAGYVGGDFATLFADGQMRVTRQLSMGGSGGIRIGAGAWGGAQRGVARLDIGPTASIAIPVGDTTAQISLDYRQRVAGQAAPGSGLALTVSAGF